MKPRVFRSGSVLGVGLVVLLLNPCAKLIPPAMAYCVDYGSYVHVAGTGAIDFTPVDMAVSGSSIFTAAGSFGLRVIDITDPLSPIVVGQASVPSFAERVYVSGERAYVTDSSGKLLIFDVHDPPLPVLLGSVDTPENTVDVAVEGDTAYVTTYYDGIFVIDVSNPAAPTIIGALPLESEIYGLAVRLPYVYVLGNQRMHVIDVDNPTDPVLVTTVPLPDYASRIVLSGDRGYVACADSGMVILDVTNPILPVVTGSAPTPGPAWDIKISGTLAFVQAFLEGMYIFDISSPDAPLLSGDYHTTDAFWAIAVAGTHAYVPAYYKILAVDVADPHPYDVLGRADIPDRYGNKVALDRNLAYMTGPYTGLHIMDVSNPAAPSIIGGIDLPGQVDNADIAIRYGYAYLAYGDYTFVVRVEDPAHPINVRNLDMDGCQARAVALRGIYLYILDNCDRLWVADVSYPPQAHLLDHIWMSFRPLTRDFVLVGRYAYAAGQEIVVLDLSNPVDPVVAATSAAPATVAAMAAAGSFLYLLGVQDSFCIMDISNPLAPIRRGCIDLPSGEGAFISDVSVAGSYAYLTDHEKGLQIVDVSNPDDPRIVGSMTDVEDTFGVVSVSVGHDYVYQLDANRLEILPRECEPAASPEPAGFPGSPALVASPQPSSGETTLRFSLPRSAEARIDILDAAGRRVRSLHESAAVAGTNRVIWDGRDDGGRDVGSGIYFVRLRSGDRTATSRLMILR